MEYLGLIITIGIGVFTIVASMIALMLWVRTEANADRREWQAETKDFREKWAQESKDFHGRLCAIEERRNKFLFKE